ncbi:MAG: hypothetical protein D6735_09225 [Acidobacteria bacterium]|nr:MAG: hypothetical protein D6735_09225 [Acidobacteriota bacterium]
MINNRVPINFKTAQIKVGRNRRLKRLFALLFLGALSAVLISVSLFFVVFITSHDKSLENYLNSGILAPPKIVPPNVVNITKDESSIYVDVVTQKSYIVEINLYYADALLFSTTNTINGQYGVENKFTLRLPFEGYAYLPGKYRLTMIFKDQEAEIVYLIQRDLM